MRQLCAAYFLALRRFDKYQNGFPTFLIIVFIECCQQEVFLMTSSQGGSKGLQRLNNCVKAECQGDVNGFGGIGRGSQGDDESTNSRVIEYVQDGCNQVAVQGNNAPQPPQQPPQGSLIHWERFLHLRSIKVMLVENDDCTRHVLAALLRNCNYEVIEAANGFQAWKILKNLSIHIDIVLTEVVMPSLSGIGLLCKITSHKTRKNIPVIMMSSHDAMGLVFKCLSKGAVDFLVKPIRKNELKNLWQHVWRRCHSSSGSGSESGTHAQKSVNSKSNLRYDNSGSKDGDDDGSSGDGSGTQSSWTKQAVEPDSPEAASPCDQTTEHPDSTCGIVIRPVQTLETRHSNDREEQPYNDEKSKEITICESRNSEMQAEFPIDVPMKHDGIKQNMDQLPDHSMDNEEIEGQEEPEKIMNASTQVIENSNHVNGKEVQNGCNIFRHSELSAFTRYKTTTKGAPGISASCSQPDNRLNILNKESTRNAHSDGYIIYQGSSEQVIPRKFDGITPADVQNQELHIQHIHHHHHVHHYHSIDTEQPLSNHDEFGSNNMAADAPHCGSSNIMGGPVEENYSLNRSASAGKSGSGDASESGSRSGNRVDLQKPALREAALTKFRQKRELRCFQKKVRYQNRKRLAEQRPRVRGQFVKGTNRDGADD